VGILECGQRYYISAGSDTHDVWNDQSGRVRTFAHLDGQVTPQAFAQALKAGHAYVSYGPLIFPSVMFGTEMQVGSGEPFTLAFDLASVAGLGKAALISAGNLEVSRAFADDHCRPTSTSPSAPTHPAGMRSRSRISADARPTPIRSG